MQNKANFPRFCAKNGYLEEKQSQFKANSKPIKPNQSQFKANSNPISNGAGICEADLGVSLEGRPCSLIIDYCPRFRGDDNIIWLKSLGDVFLSVENVCWLLQAVEPVVCEDVKVFVINGAGEVEVGLLAICF